MDCVHKDANNVVHGPPMDIEPIRGGLGRFIYDACKKYAKRTFQVLPAYNFSETYEDFLTRSIRVAIEMRRRGVKCGDLIVNCTENTTDSVLIPAAAFFLGAASSTIDPSLSVRDAAHLLTLIKARCIFVQEKHVGMIEEASKLVNADVEIIVYGTTAKYVQFDEFLKPTSDENQFEPVFIDDPKHISIILFSSGTTGLPKAIELSHGRLYIGASTFMHSLSDTKCILHYTTFYWITAVLLFCGQFIEGSTRVADNFTNGGNFYNVVQTCKVTATFLATFYAMKLLDSADQISNYDLSSLKVMIFGGVPMRHKLHEELRSVFKDIMIFSGYGMSEIASFATAFSAEEYSAYKNKIACCGRPIIGTHIKILDTNDGHILEANKPGEIFIKSASAMNGYHNNTEAKPFDADGFFQTGDIGYYDTDNCFYVIDRIKDMFKYQCWHIVPKSIENVIGEHPDVEASVVFGIPDDAAGHLPAAAVKLKPNATITTTDIERFVAERVADRQKLRGGVYIVAEFPRTPSGKILKQQVTNLIMSQREQS